MVTKSKLRQRMRRCDVAQGASELASRDRRLAALVDQFGLPPLWQRPQGLRTLVHIVLEQKVSIVSARAVMARVDDLCSEYSPNRFLKVKPASLRAAGVSERKVEYCRGIATAISEGALNLARLRHLDDDDAMAQLETVRGIGPWTASVYLTMAMGRPNVWTTGDRALAVSYAECWSLDVVPTYPELEAAASRWQPWRAVAARILWHAYLSKRGRR